MTAADSQSRIPFPTLVTRNRRHLSPSVLTKRSLSRNLPITATVLLPIYLRSKNISSSAVNSRIASCSSADTDELSSSVPAALAVVDRSELFRFVEDGRRGKFLTDRQRRSIWLRVAHVSSVIELCRKSPDTNSSILRRPFTANAPESEPRQLLIMANISSTRVSSSNTLMDRRQICIHPSMNGSNVVSSHVGISLEMLASPVLGEVRNLSKSGGSAGVFASWASTSPNSRTGLKIPR
mmetsp:Transcript_59906/g.147229  ORF Transcript_59906/g.147229 Transcript_59906/m.147229 type:complete len:238 (+) Transcript_59906:1090-1803(+)